MADTTIDPTRKSLSYVPPEPPTTPEKSGAAKGTSASTKTQAEAFASCPAFTSCAPPVALPPKPTTVATGLDVHSMDDKMLDRHYTALTRAWSGGDKRPEVKKEIEHVEKELHRRDEDMAAAKLNARFEALQAKVCSGTSTEADRKELAAIETKLATKGASASPTRASGVGRPRSMSPSQRKHGRPRRTRS